ncbi:MAG TPA: hypothetical protein VF765_12045 [Polyangiaceae bacterium]
MARADLEQRQTSGTSIVTRPTVERGRMGMYVAMGATVGAVPLPWLPGTIAKRVRGSLLHDIAVRHGVSLTPEARVALADPSALDAPRGWIEQGLRFVGVRLAARAFTRLGPIGMVWPVRDAVRTFALGHLFDRYLASLRTERAVRIDVEEARRVRQAIDGAFARAVTLAPEPLEEPTPVDDQRDAMTALLDGLLSLAAGVPDRLVRRLDLAFDELVGGASSHG